jgi:hypothetical protein
MCSSFRWTYSRRSFPFQGDCDGLNVYAWELMCWKHSPVMLIKCYLHMICKLLHVHGIWMRQLGLNQVMSVALPWWHWWLSKKKKRDPGWRICSVWHVTCSVVLWGSKETLTTCPCHSLGLPNLQNHKINKPLFFINYPISGILS